MAGRTLLHLTRDGLAWHPQPPSDATPPQRFSPTHDGLARFAEHLAQHTTLRFTLLVDVPDEFFTVEPLPKLSAGDRRALLARRRERLAHETPYFTEAPLPALAGDAPADDCLFASLVRPDQLKPWLDALRHANAALTGIHSAPFAALPLLRHLPPPPGPAQARLVASLGPAGLRVSCYTGPHLRFSRLTPAEPHAWHTHVQELLRTRQHLASQRLLPRETPLQLLFIAPQAAHGAIRQLAPPDLDCVDLAALARACGAPEPPDADLTPLLHRTLARHRRIPSIHTPGLQRQHTLRRAGTALILGAALFASAAGVVAYGTLDATQTTRQDIDRLRQHIANAERAIAQAQAAIPPTSMPPERIHAAHQRLPQLLAGSQPTAALHAISRALTRFPQVSLTRLDWSFDPHDTHTAPRLDLRLALPDAAPDLADAFTQALREQTRATVSPIDGDTLDTDAPRQRLGLRLTFDTPPR